MPTYDYVCEQCEHAFEEFQSITAKPLRKCPECGKNRLRRLIGTGGGVIFKGAGFYETDYRSESYKKAAEAEKPKPAEKSDSGSTDKASSGGSDAKKPDAPAASPKPPKSASKPRKPAK